MGAIGEPRLIHVAFTFPYRTPPTIATTPTGEGARSMDVGSTG